MDLYYRLNTFTIEVSSLEGKEDRISKHAEKFLREYEWEYQKKKVLCGSDFMRYLFRHDWPGNLRELKNVMEYARVVCEGEELKLEHLPEYFLSTISTRNSHALSTKGLSLDFAKAKKDFEKQFFGRSSL